MRIGMISGEYPPQQGGVGAYARILGRALADAGHSVAVLSGPEAREDDSRFTLDVAADWNAGCWNTVNSWARHRHLEVINLQYQTAAFGMSPWIHLLPTRVSAAPVVVTFHDLRFPYLFPKAGPLRPWIVNRLARTAAGVITTNPEDYEPLRALPLSVMIPIGSNIGADAAPAVERTDSTGTFEIVYFGLLNRGKGLDQLLEALAGLRSDGLPAHLTIIGSAGSSDPTNQAYEAELRGKVSELNLSNHVAFTSFLPDAEVHALLQRADAVALPFLDGASLRRGSLMAALRAGCAIVTTTPTVRVEAFSDE
ncbi:MAG TPA: glycosyltransferase family 4 protein, partial [Candidatus Limnocylindrales bacterium]|nr:glycosyltransferase family 4 protein [Candidatus Limnocylindrales bacterium]